MQCAILAVEDVQFDNGVATKVVLWNPQVNKAVEVWGSQKALKDAGYNPDMVLDLSDTLFEVTVETVPDVQGRLKPRITKIEAM